MSVAHSHNHRRPSLLGPVILIAAGVLALMYNYGYLPGNFWETLWRLWPLILVVLGFEILIAQFRGPWVLNLLVSLLVVLAAIATVVYVAQQSAPEWPLETSKARHVEQDLQGATTARVMLKFGAGSLRVAGAGDSDKLMIADFTQPSRQADVRVSYHVAGGQGNLTVEVSEDQVVIGPFVSAGRGNQWDLRLNESVPLDLEIAAGASSAELDLTELRVTQLTVKGGVSTSTVRLPKSGSYSADISGGLATTTVEVPEGVAARIRVQGGLSSVNVDRSRFPKVGDEYVSPDFDTAANRVTLRITGGLSSVKVR